MCNGQTVPPFPLSVQPPLCSAHARVPAAAMQFINFNNDNRATEFEEGVVALEISWFFSVFIYFTANEASAWPGLLRVPPLYICTIVAPGTSRNLTKPPETETEATAPFAVPVLSPQQYPRPAFRSSFRSLLV